MRVYLDLETRSIAPLERVGVYEYAEDPSTSIMGFSFAFDDEPPEWVDVRAAREIPARLYDHMRRGGEVWAHNAQFERVLWNTCMDHPPLVIPQMRCTMAMARSMGLPGSLEMAALAVGIEVRKDMRGRQVMLRLCRPMPGASWWPDACPSCRGSICPTCRGTGRSGYEELGQYCMQDVRVERELARRILPLSSSEQSLWELDQEINDRGIAVSPLLPRALARVEEERSRLDVSMRKITEGEVSSCSAHIRLTRWLQDHLVPMTSVDQESVGEALVDPDIPPIAREVLEIRRDASKASTAKLEALRAGSVSTGRARGLLLFHGAHTGRWTGRGFQPQNLPRPVLPSSAIEWIFSQDFQGASLAQISDCIRGLLVPTPGFRFVGLDYAQIEARILAWLSREESVMRIFRSHGKLYEATAAEIYSIPMESVKKDSRERQVAKSAALGLGYGMGAERFRSYCASSAGVHLPMEEAQRIVSDWRAARPATLAWWRELSDAALSGQAPFRKDGSFLFCRLPSGRDLCYPYPKIEMKVTPWGEEREALTYMAWKNRHWLRVHTFGGKLAENIVQATSRDLLADALMRLREYRPVLTVHDEILLETTASVEHCIQIASVPPHWATGLPIRIEGWTGERYRK